MAATPASPRVLQVSLVWLGLLPLLDAMLRLPALAGLGRHLALVGAGASWAALLPLHGPLNALLLLTAGLLVLVGRGAGRLQAARVLLGVAMGVSAVAALASLVSWLTLDQVSLHGPLRDVTLRLSLLGAVLGMLFPAPLLWLLGRAVPPRLALVVSPRALGLATLCVLLSVQGLPLLMHVMRLSWLLGGTGQAMSLFALTVGAEALLALLLLLVLIIGAALIAARPATARAVALIALIVSLAGGGAEFALAGVSAAQGVMPLTLVNAVQVLRQVVAAGVLLAMWRTASAPLPTNEEAPVS